MHLQSLFGCEDDWSTTRNLDSDIMSLLEKMTLWNSKAAMDEEPNIPYPNAQFEGVEDDEDESISLAKLSAYCNVIFKSGALSSLVSRLRTRSLLQWESDGVEDLAVNEIRRKILAALPSGKISKRQQPREHQITFRLQWGHIIARRPWQDQRTRVETVVITVCSGKAQMASVEQYTSQTWPRTCDCISGLIDEAACLKPGSRYSSNIYSCKFYRFRGTVHSLSS